MRIAWLFDIDGTLLHTGGAARESFAHAVHAVLGVQDDLADIAFAGRTEPLIVADILAKHGLRLDDGLEPRFWNTVFDEMRRRLRPGRGRVLPGVTDLLDAVEREPAWVGGLLTGNMTQMARIKLRHYGLADRFHFGGFGEMAGDRNALARLVVAEVGSRYGVPPDRCVVVGDTVHDVTCARAAGARVIAVATGGTERDVLASHEPDLMLDDLTDTSGIVAWVRGVADAGMAPRR